MAVSGTAKAVAAPTVHFTQEALHKSQKDAEDPSLPQESGGKKPITFDADFDKQINDRSERLARRRAFDLNKEVFPRGTTFKDEHNTFFQTNKNDQNDCCTEKSVASDKHRTITIGTDCSGMEAPIQALRNLQVPYEHIFSCDNDPHVQETISANFAPRVLYDDVTERDNTAVRSVDVYVAGFPCQPFSVAGKQQGFNDSQGRGVIFWNILQYIEVRRPNIFILENVKGLTTLDNGKYLKQILKALNNIGVSDAKKRGRPGSAEQFAAYEIHHTIMNTKNNGVPQDRARWYCVGIRKGCLREPGNIPFEWPETINCPGLDMFLDSDAESGSAIRKLSNTAQANICTARNAIEQAGGDPYTDHYIIDCDAPKSWVPYGRTLSPCITRSRHAGHWITSKNRRFTKEEMFRLQGMDPTTFTVAVPERSLGQQIGNAMSVNVIERVLLRALKAANLIPNDTEDRWNNGKAIQTLSKTRGKSFKEILTTTNPHLKDTQRITAKMMTAKNRHSRFSRFVIVDSGASFHMVNKDDLTEEELATSRPMKAPRLITTANGVIEIDTECDFWVGDLGPRTPGQGYESNSKLVTHREKPTQR